MFCIGSKGCPGLSCSATFEQLSSVLNRFLAFEDRTFHNFKAPIKFLILDIGCFHHDTPFTNNIYTLSKTIVAVENTGSGGLPVVVLQGSTDVVKNSKWQSWTMAISIITRLSWYWQGLQWTPANIKKVFQNKFIVDPLELPVMFKMDDKRFTKTNQFLISDISIYQISG